MGRCRFCDAYVSDGEKFCTGCGSRVSDDVQDLYYQRASGDKEYHLGPGGNMKWYKFLIYFLLFLSMIGNVLGGILILSGEHYGSSLMAQIVYMTYSGMKFLDILMGVFCVAIAVFAFFTRRALARFEEKGPKYVVWMYVINAVVSLFYYSAVQMIVSDMGIVTVSDYITDVGAPLLWAVVNHYYFKKRQELFCE